MGPSFPQNPWVPFYTSQKFVGSVEPTEPMLTTPLYHLYFDPQVLIKMELTSSTFSLMKCSYSNPLLYLHTARLFFPIKKQLKHNFFQNYFR